MTTLHIRFETTAAASFAADSDVEYRHMAEGQSTMIVGAVIHECAGVELQAAADAGAVDASAKFDQAQIPVA